MAQQRVKRLVKKENTRERGRWKREKFRQLGMF